MEGKGEREPKGQDVGGGGENSGGVGAGIHVEEGSVRVGLELKKGWSRTHILRWEEKE